MTTFKKHKVVMLTTNEKAKIYLHDGINNKTLVSDEIRNKHYPRGAGLYKPQHLYILSDEEIKKVDWFIYDGKLYNEFKTSITPNVTIWIRLYPHLDLSEQWREIYIQDCKKIIATTDKSLFTHRLNQPNSPIYFRDELYPLPEIPQSFIDKFVEEYNKGNVITDVLVEYEEYILQHLNKPQENLLRLKINPDNTITIKSVKDSWNREEVLSLIYDINRGVFQYEAGFDLDKLIEENL